MKICVISGNRADVSALTPVAQALEAFWIFVDTLPSRDRHDMAVSCGQASMMAADQLAELKPDLAILAGDRFEILGAACAAHWMQIPIAHLSGGDVTEGSQDDAARHAISKLASLHFPTNEASAQRLEMMGEEKWRIHMVGAPQIDYLLKKELYTREETLKLLRVEPTDKDKNFILVAYQPSTRLEDPTTEIDELLEDLFRQGWPCIFTTLNTDFGALGLEEKILKFPHNKIVKMDQKLFLSAMKHCVYMIGNSSAGFYEAPTLGTLFQNWGHRQDGRTPIKGDGKAAERIAKAIRDFMQLDRTTQLKKRLQCSMSPGRESTPSTNGASTQRKSSSGGLWAGDLGAEHEYSISDRDKPGPLGF